MGSKESKQSLISGFDPFKVIRAALRGGGEFSDLYVEDSHTTAIVCEEDRIEKVSIGRDRGAGLRVIAGLKTYYAFTNDLTEPGLMELAAVVASAVRSTEAGCELGPVSRLRASDENIKIPPGSVALAERIELVKRANSTAWAADKRVKQVKVVYGDARRRIAVVNSEGTSAEEDRTGLILVCHVVARDGEVVQTGYEPLGGAVGLELFDSSAPEEVAKIAAARAVMMLSARKSPGGKMAVVLSSEAGGTMIHEAVGHGLEADLAEQNLSVYSGKLGQRVASPLITVFDDGTIPNKRGSSYFDEEATRTEKTLLVDKGVLKGYLYDRLSAMKDDAVTTGNGRRQSYKHKPIPRMTNTLIAPGTTPPEAIIGSLDKGLLVKRMGGGQVNTVNGDFVFEITEGYLVEHGKPVEPVRGATLTGNGPEVLASIDMVGSDLGFGIGTCGKDGQGVPVADAQPTLRIPEIVVGGVSGGD